MLGNITIIILKLLLILILDCFRVLGEMLGSIMKDQQPDVFNKVERLRKLGREV